MPRQAFLLVALEGLSEDDAAKVLDIDVPKLRELVEDSGRELAAEIATDVLIIEDETFIALDLEGLVEGLGHRVLGVARTHSEAMALAKAKRPGIILADIQLADGSSGLDAVNEMLRSFEVPVIFITAYPERFLTGERPEPAFLIAKPFQPATVSAVLEPGVVLRAQRQAARAQGELAGSVAFACQSVAEHHGFDEHGDLHVALAAEHRRGRFGGLAARDQHDGDDDGDGGVNRAHDHARVQRPKLRFQGNRSSNGEEIKRHNRQGCNDEYE